VTEHAELLRIALGNLYLMGKNHMNRAEDDTPRSTLRTSLPAIMTSFVGRELEATDTKNLLASSRQVTLIGAAGCGKTRLAVYVASSLSSDYRDGAHFIDFTRLDDPALIPQFVARALHIAEQPGRSWLDTLVKGLHDRHLLLILDNCEHVLSACTQLANLLLEATSVRILATSREPLRVRGEIVYPLNPMSLPPASTTPDDISQSDAIQLFVERARAVLPSFELTAENAQGIISICRKLDGIPLAIELASARVNVLAVEQIAARLDDRFALLSTPSHVTHNPHETLQAALDWSHDLLSNAEQALLRRLAVFAGGFSLRAAEAVCAGEAVRVVQVLDLLSSLVNKSLVVANTLQRNEARYTLLETIRQYAHQELVAAGEWAVLRDRHLQHLLKLTEETEPKLLGEYQQLWLDWLEGEFDNIRAAVVWSLESSQIESGLRIIVALYQFWTIRDYAEEGFAWVEQLLAKANDSVALAVRANAVAYAMTLAGFRGHSQAIQDYSREAAFLAETAGLDKDALRWALTGQYYAARVAGDHETEYALAMRILQLQRESGTTYELGTGLTIFSFTAMSIGKYDIARAMLDEGLPLLRQLKNPYRVAMALNFSGDLSRCEQNYAQAQAAYEESIALLREIDAVRDLASALHNLGHACLHLGAVVRAHDLFNESMAIHQTQANTPGITECLIGYAALAIVAGLPAAGARLLAALVAIGGERVVSAWAATQMEYEHYLALASASLSEAEFQAEQIAGRALSLEQAIAYAQKTAIQAVALTKTSKSPDELTSREREVAALIAQARSNGDIADKLVLSKRTVEKHIANIRSKLGFTQRAEIVRWAIDNNLLPQDE
jgi:predicted ATPase/DNA-binding CsgD family transcriptional regulator